MRIISGSLGGRRFAPRGGKFPTRPTTDLAKEALFNILVHQMDLKDARFLDLFGGLGGITLEAISRGCPDVTYVDKHAGCYRFVEETLTKFGVSQYAHLVRAEVERFLRYEMVPYDVIFADPPYRWAKLAVIPEWIFENNLLLPGGILIVEHDVHTYLEHYREFVESKKYGQTVFSFFKMKEMPDITSKP